MLNIQTEFHLAHNMRKIICKWAKQARHY